MAEGRERKIFKRLIVGFKIVIMNKFLPICSKIWSQLKTNSDQIKTITTVVGVLLLIWTLYETRQENKVTQTTLEQSYRPIGYINIIDPARKFEPVDVDDNGKVVLKTTDRYFINVGEGILFYIGFVRFSESKFIDFHLMNFMQYINKYNIKLDINYNFDNENAMERLRPKLTNEQIYAQNIWKNLDKKDIYYLYYVYFYKNQDQTLFETIYLDFLKLSKPIENNGDLLQTERYYHNQFIHEYSEEEQDKLARYIEKIHPGFAEYIRR
jgi:hypothetical protein